MIKAEIICDSKTAAGDRLTTFVVTFPRIVLSEFNTHRVFSRNSASSRAIPFKRLLQNIQENPFIPIAWMKDHTGMQGTEYYSKEEKFSLPDLENIMCERLMKIYDTEDGDNLELMDMFHKLMDEFPLFSSYTLDEFWLIIRDKVLNCALLLSLLGVTKQVVNRLIEPFMWHTAIVTSSEWENFFALRAHEGAEIHIQDLAYKMMDAYNTSEPKLLQPGQWHIPFGDNLTNEELSKFCFQNHETESERNELRLKIATARCARVSYMTHDGVRDLSKDIEMHERLAASGHWSPFEHCAQAMTDDERELWCSGKREADGHEKLHKKSAHGWCGNFRGFIQYRKTFAGENKKDKRVKQ